MKVLTNRFCTNLFFVPSTELWRKNDLPQIGFCAEQQQAFHVFRVRLGDEDILVTDESGKRSEFGPGWKKKKF
jgi:hypothetical protein